MRQLKPPNIESGARVIGYGGSKLGTVHRPIHDPESGEITAFTMRCGLLGRKYKLVPVEHIKQVNPGSGTVIVRFGKKDLQDMLNADAASGDAGVQVSLPRREEKILDGGT